MRLSGTQAELVAKQLVVFDCEQLRYRGVQTNSKYLYQSPLQAFVVVSTDHVEIGRIVHTWLADMGLNSKTSK